MGSRTIRRAALLSIAGLGAAVWAFRPPPHVGHDPRLVADRLGGNGAADLDEMGPRVDRALRAEQLDGI
jgi:hypothetical protein